MIATIGAGHDGVGAAGQREQMREKRRGHERHVAGQNHGRVASRLGQRGVETAERPAATHAVGDHSDGDRCSISVRRLATDDHDVKCDLRDSKNDLTVAEIKDAVDRAASLKLPIGRFVIATTTARPEGLQRSLFDLNRSNRSGTISAIEVLTWDDIEELLDEYPQILTDFGTSAKRQALTRADAVVHLEARCEPAAVGPSDALGEEISAADGGIATGSSSSRSAENASSVNASPSGQITRLSPLER